MLRTWLQSVVTCAMSACALSAELPERPDPNATEPLAKCSVQAIAAPQKVQYEPAPVGLYSLSRPPNDLLANYERTPLGDWPIPAPAERTDPWIRLLLLSRKQPVVIDIAVFIDGRSFREVREDWVDQALADARLPVDEAATEDASGGPGNNQTNSQGTNSAAAASHGESNEAKDGADAKNGSSVATQARQAPTMRKRLLNHVAITGGDADRSEIAWLLAESGAGPGIVVLSTDLSWQRAGLSPLLTYLDKNDDAAVSASELANVEALMKRADYNGDDVIEASEFRRVTESRSAQATNGHPLIATLDANTDFASLADTMHTLYSHQHNESASDPRAFLMAPADISLRVDFVAEQKQPKASTGLALISVREGISAGEVVVAANDALSIDIGGDFVEVTAAQTRIENGDDFAASQIAVGAVIDGHPLLRLVDRDQDARLTLRERQEVPSLLGALDSNSDGDVSNAEIPMPIRLAVTLGPHVHQLLAKPTGSVRSIAPRAVAPAPPEWFASMDKNNDLDLSPGEFLGTSEQFRQFDTDGDGLLSIAEAQKLDAGQ